MQEQFGYAYDKAWNLNERTNNAMVQTFGENGVNELTTSAVAGTLTVAGTATEPAANPPYSGVTNLTVNGQPADVYGDSTFAAAGFTPANGNNAYTAIAQDTYGRNSTNSVTVTVSSSADYTYDSNGNLTSDGTRNFAYNDENQLIAVWVANTWSNSFAYDGLMRKRIEQDFAWNGSGWTQTNETFYVYDGNLVLQERDGNNEPLTTYTRGIDLSGTLQGAGGIGGLLARSDNQKIVPAILSPVNPNPQNVVTSYYFNDGQGNVVALVSPGGMFLAQYEYDPFGNLISKSGLMADMNKYRFSSKEWDENDGLYYYGFRFYDSNLQRWPNQDPFGEYGGLNLYGYVYNDPLGMLDPYGLALFGLYDSWGDYWGNVGNTFEGEAKGAGSELSFGLYHPCYQNSLQRQGGYVGQGLAMTGETLGGGLAGWRAAGDAAKGLEYSHWVPARALPGGRGGLLDNLTKAAKLNGNYVSKAEHYAQDPFRYPPGWQDMGQKLNPVLQQLDRIPRFPAGIAAGAGVAAAGAVASQVPNSPCH